MYDNPLIDDDSVFDNVDFSQIEFSNNGFSRHVFHAIKEIACELKLYVLFVHHKHIMCKVQR